MPLQFSPPDCPSRDLLVWYADIVPHSDIVWPVQDQICKPIPEPGMIHEAVDMSRLGLGAMTPFEVAGLESTSGSKSGESCPCRETVMHTRNVHSLCLDLKFY